jgi:hypothetical protein
MPLTLEELFAGVFLEEGFVVNRAQQVVEHEVVHRLDLLLRVSRIEGESLILEIWVSILL